MTVMGRRRKRRGQSGPPEAKRRREEANIQPQGAPGVDAGAPLLTTTAKHTTGTPGPSRIKPAGTSGAETKSKSHKHDKKFRLKEARLQKLLEKKKAMKLKYMLLKRTEPELNKDSVAAGDNGQKSSAPVANDNRTEAIAKHRKKRKKKMKLKTASEVDSASIGCSAAKDNVAQDGSVAQNSVAKDSVAKSKVAKEGVAKKGGGRDDAGVTSRGSPGVIVDYPRDASLVSANWRAMQALICGDKKQKKLKRKAEKRRGGADLPGAEVKDTTAAEIWFDGVDASLLDLPPQQAAALQTTQPRQQTTEIITRGRDDAGTDDTTAKLVKQRSFAGLTHAVAMDCEMVGVGADGKDNMLARVSIVNQFGNCIYDTFVKPREKVTDFRTHVSGVRASNLKTGAEFAEVQRRVADVLKGRMLVGHAIHNDLKVLYLTHPRSMIRDTQQYKPFRKLFSGGRPSLKKLTDKVLGVQVQTGEHSSVQDAQATMRLYTMHKQQWERELRDQRAAKQTERGQVSEKRRRKNRNRHKKPGKKAKLLKPV